MLNYKLKCDPHLLTEYVECLDFSLYEVKLDTVKIMINYIPYKAIDMNNNAN